MRPAFEETAVQLVAQANDTGDDEEAQPLRGYYGVSWFYCMRRACASFHDGFGSARERDQHIDHRMRPYRCKIRGCLAADIRCASERIL
jgi:hypothetical protein